MAVLSYPASIKNELFHTPKGGIIKIAPNLN